MELICFKPFVTHTILWFWRSLTTAGEPLDWVRFECLSMCELSGRKGCASTLGLEVESESTRLFLSVLSYFLRKESMMNQSTNRPSPHRLHRAYARPSEARVQRHPSAHAHQPFRPLPVPTGLPPYHLVLADVLPPGQIEAITNAGRLVFHVVGDTGGIKTPVPQMNVAQQMERDSTSSPAESRPAFFYHLGDVVYFYGEAQEYYPQFYEPYSSYQAPIFAIPGNHDGDLSRDMQAQGVPSLAAFVTNFCASIPHHTPDAQEEPRHAMTQPNVYWTLETPLVTIIGLYTNVPEGGWLDDDQIRWLEEELQQAPKDRALIVAMHHPIYSYDDHHSGSSYMHRVLDEAMQQTGRMPDLVLAGHVHNYQRFTRQLNGRSLPYLVAGAGGYHNLHRVPRSLKEPAQPLPFAVPEEEGVLLETFCDDQFGFLRLSVTAQTLKGDYFTVSGFQDPNAGQDATHYDAFTLDLKAGTVTTTLAEEHRKVTTTHKGSRLRHPRN
jgi:Icc-related predicted phosphoesterase